MSKAQRAQQTVLDVCDLTIALPAGGDRAYAVEGLHFAVRANEIVCIVGESGSGKSITAYATMGLLPQALSVRRGTLRFLQHNVLALTPGEHARLRGNQMAMIFQEPMTALNPCFTVGTQIEEVFAAHTSLSRIERRDKTLALLTEVNLPEPERMYRSYPHQLSGGQRQRIVIAIALALSPKLLIADEPTTALDVTTQAQILALLKTLKEKYQAGILFITHDFDVVADIADRVVVMEQGKIVEQGDTRQIIAAPRHPYTQKLLDAVPRYRHREDQQSDKRSSNNLQRPRDARRPIVLEVVDLAKQYTLAGSLGRAPRVVTALHPTSFALEQGQTLGIVGESGSGKSTLVRCLTRLIEPDAGAIRIDSQDLMALSGTQLRAWRKHIQIVFQDPYGSLNPRRRIGEQLLLGALNFGMSRQRAWEKAQDLLDIVQMRADALYRYPSQFSGGQRQRLCIARALMVEPKILIADEAVSALDVSVQKEVLQLLEKIKTEMGLTILFITHDLRVAAQISDRLIVMHQGRVVEAGSVHEVFLTPQQPYTQALLAAMPGPDLFAQ